MTFSLPTSTLFLLAATLLCLPSVSAVAEEDLCANNTVQYSPFTPWFVAWPNVTSGPGANDASGVNNLACWWYADCQFSHASNTRQQQYSAVGLVMGLIPLVLKDIAWPSRRIAYIPARQKWWVETLVRGLGLNPTVTNKAIKEGFTVRNRVMERFLLAALSVLFVVSLGPLAVMELYSKRSSLGCPVPVFVVLWFVVAFIPAALEVIVSRLIHPHAVLGEDDDDDKVAQVVMSTTVSDDAVPGGNAGWLVQLVWAVYFSAGTLIWNSIMLVTVIELLCWFLSACFVTAASKMLAYKLCGYWGPGFER